MMSALAVSYLGLAPLWRELMARGTFFLADAWRLHLGDRRSLQQYAAKYCGHQPRHSSFE